MPLVLPDSPGPRTAAVERIHAEIEISPAFGGDTLSLERAGSRYRYSVSLPPLTYEEALAWSDIETCTDTVVMTVCQPGVDVGNPPAPLVKGANQTGSLLVVDGLGAGYVVKKGIYLSVITAGRRRLYRTKASVTANAGGEAILQLRTLLRASPADNDVVEIMAPKIEGKVKDFRAVEVNEAWHTEISFAIEERG